MSDVPKVTADRDSKGQIYVTLSYVRVGSEHNYDEEILLSEAEARELADKLQQALSSNSPS